MGTVDLDFVVGGAPKAATTSVMNALREHPGVYVPARKELSFFDREGCLLRLDELEPHFADAAPGQRRGEGTPWYMSSPLAAESLSRAYPDLRIVFILREPLARAKSHYLHRVARHMEDRSFDRAVDDEVAELATNRSRHRRSYLIRPGLYASHIAVWSRHFPAEQIEVVLFEDLVRDPGATLRSVQSHLGLEYLALDLPSANRTRGLRAETLGRIATRLIRSDGTAKRLVQRVTPKGLRSWTRRTIASLNQSARRPTPVTIGEAQLLKLRQHFDPEVLELSRVLGRPLDAWFSSPSRETSNSS